MSTARPLLAGTIVMAALGGLAATAVPASAQNWNIPHNIRYPFFPECNRHMSPFEPGYGTMTCKGEYKVNRGNYMFTQDNTHSCPVMGKLQRITLYYVLNPADGGVTHDQGTGRVQHALVGTGRRRQDQSKITLRD